MSPVPDAGNAPPPTPLRARILPGILHRLERVGLEIEPFIVHREGVEARSAAPPGEGYRCGFVGAEAIDGLLYLEPDAGREELLERVRRGILCFAVREGDRIVAKMWCHLESLDHPPIRRRLERNEAYLFGARSAPDSRGHGLAPYMRLACYAALRELGRDTFWSYTHYFSRPARRFKEKAGAVPESLRVSVRVFGRPLGCWTLRRYAASTH